jgi:uncharacterized protein YkwD
MNSCLNLLAGLTALLALALSPPAAWGQLKTKSGAAVQKENTIRHHRELERRIFALTNDVRRRNSLPPLTLDGNLTAIAQKYSDDMLQRQFFSHTDPDGKGLNDRLKAEEKPGEFSTMSRAGENIASMSRLDLRDVGTTARMIMDGWMTSPGHRANILNPTYTHLGVGVSVLGQEIRATQNFAQRKGPN